MNLTLAFWTGLPLDSPFMSTVDVIISAYSHAKRIMKQFYKSTFVCRVQFCMNYNSLFSTANPLFFRISATVTTVAIAAIMVILEGGIQLKKRKRDEKWADMMHCTSNKRMLADNN